jgi:hypothetical protein
MQEYNKLSETVTDQKCVNLIIPLIKPYSTYKPTYIQN